MLFYKIAIEVLRLILVVPKIWNAAMGMSWRYFQELRARKLLKSFQV